MAGYATNRVFRVLVAGSAQAGVATGISSLANGELITIKRDGTLATAATINEYHSNGDEVQIVIGTGNPYVIQKTDFFSPKDITKYAKQSYAAEVQKVMSVNYSTASTIVANFEYSLVINETSDKEILQARQARTQFTVVANSFDTIDTIGANLATQVNANPYAPVTASYSTPTLTLTAKDTSVLATRYVTNDFKSQIYFEVNSKVTQSGIANSGYNNYYSAYGVVSTPSVGVYTAPGFGEGTYRQIYTLEKLSQAYKGASNFIKFPVDQGEYFSVPGATYDVRVLEFRKTHDTGSATLGLIHSPQTYIFAIPTGSSETAALDALFAQTGVGSSTIDDN